MGKPRKILLLSGLGTLADHLVAAAIALRRFPGAELGFASMGLLPEKLREEAVAQYDEIHLLGIGLEANPTELENAFRTVHKRGASIVWHSAGFEIPPQISAEMRTMFEARVDAGKCLAAWLAKDLGVEAEPLLALLDDKVQTKAAQGWRKRITAVGWNFSNAHDLVPLRNTACDLADGLPEASWAEPVKTLIKHWEAFGTRELQASGPKMRRLLKDIRRIARSSARRVLVTGESGVGKETVAQQLHVQSGRRGPYISFNCATVASSLIESRLFGHVKGAFTDAKTAAPGLFQEAHGGTLFLDEIGELPLEVQGVLLRVLQDGVVQPVGAAKEVRVDVLVVAATNRDLREMVNQRLFREDLYWRLSVVQILMPPLRERGGDIAATAQQIWARLAPKGRPLTKDDLAAIEAYDWPGNVRELSNVLERATFFDDRTIPELVGEERAESARLAALSGAADAAPRARAAAPDGADETLAAALRAHVRRVYERHGRNLTAAAAALGITRTTARNYLAAPSA